MNKSVRIQYSLRPRELSLLQGRLAASFAAADGYAGAEPEYRALIDRAAKAERFIRRRSAGNLSPAFETAMTAQAGDAVTISGILDRAAASYDAALQAGQTRGAIERTVQYVLIPPDAAVGGIVPGDGTGKVEPPVFMERLNLLRRHLNTLGVYEDDLIIQRGTLQPGQIRQRPYVLLEIPKLDAQICVCDQVGEATFVKRGMMPVEHWASYTKTALENLPGMRRVVCNNEAQWLGEIAVALGEVDDKPKIDIRKVIEKQQSARIEIIPQMREQLENEAERTGMSNKAIADKMGQSFITTGVVNGWRNSCKTCQREQWMAVIAMLSTQPNISTKIKQIEPEDLIELEREIKRTGLSGQAIIKEMGQQKLVTAAMIESWRRAGDLGGTKTCSIECWKAVINALAKAPSIKWFEPKDLEELERQIKRTGMSCITIVNKMGDKAPIKAGSIEGWRDGHAKTCLLDHWIAVINILTNSSDVKRIEPEDFMELERQIERTGIAQYLIARQLGTQSAITAAMISGWRKGGQPRQIEDWEIVLSTYRALPDKKPKPTNFATQNPSP